MKPPRPEACGEPSQWAWEIRRHPRNGKWSGGRVAAYIPLSHSVAREAITRGGNPRRLGTQRNNTQRRRVRPDGAPTHTRSIPCRQYPRSRRPPRHQRPGNRRRHLPAHQGRPTPDRRRYRQTRNHRYRHRVSREALRLRTDAMRARSPRTPRSRTSRHANRRVSGTSRSVWRCRAFVANQTRSEPLPQPPARRGAALMGRSRASKCSPLASCDREVQGDRRHGPTDDGVCSGRRVLTLGMIVAGGRRFFWDWTPLGAVGRPDHRRTGAR